MTDLLTRMAEQPRDVLDALANSMNVRASEPAMRSICARYLGPLRAPDADVLEIGCGNGAATRLIMQHVRPARLVGIDILPVFVKMASEAFAGQPGMSFVLGEAAVTRQPGSFFDLVIAHTVYSHLVDPQAALGEAYRVLKPGGRLAIFDGDFASLTVALFDGDPLQSAASIVLHHMVHAPYIKGRSRCRRNRDIKTQTGLCRRRGRPAQHLERVRQALFLTGAALQSAKVINDDRRTDWIALPDLLRRLNGTRVWHQ